MPTFEVGLKRIEYGHTFIKAKSKEEALENLNEGELGRPVFYPGSDLIKLDTRECLEEDLIN